MNKVIASIMIIFCLGINFPMAEESVSSTIHNCAISITAEIKAYKEVKVRSKPLIKAFAAIVLDDNTGANYYAGHFAIIRSIKNEAFAANSVSVAIFDYEEGAFNHKFEIADIDKDGDDELLVWYKVGNHGHCLKIYELPGNDDYAQKPIPWKGNFYGAYWDTEIKDGYIICYDYDQDKKEKIIAERYKVQKGSAIPVESKNKSISTSKPLKDKQTSAKHKKSGAPLTRK